MIGIENAGKLHGTYKGAASLTPAQRASLEAQVAAYDTKHYVPGTRVAFTVDGNKWEGTLHAGGQHTTFLVDYVEGQSDAKQSTGKKAAAPAKKNAPKRKR